MTQAAAQPLQTRLYLVTPPSFALEDFAAKLEDALNAADVACVRLQMKGAAEEQVRAAAQRLAPICREHDAAFLMTEYYRLADELGLDGVHFERGANHQAAARELLGPEAAIGVECGASRHHALEAGERGADYVSFSPVAATPGLATGEVAPLEFFTWWQEMIELPVVAEGGMTPQIAAQLDGKADFIAASRSVWEHPEGPAAGVSAYTRVLSGA